MPKKVLLVDDERDLVETLEFRLRAAGFEVITAFDGLEALQKAREQRPDLMITDVMLPKMDGYQVCRMLKFSAEFQELPVVMLTARGQDADKQIGRDVGADLYITKPFDGGELIKKVEELLQKKR